jgi:hypothetical protein
MPEHQPDTCHCRDRDTRVLRAIIAAASRANACDPTFPKPDTDLPLPKVGNSGNNVERLVQLLVQEGILPGDLLMTAWQTLPAAPLGTQSAAELRTFVAEVRERARLLSFTRELAWQVHEAVTAQHELERRLDDDIRRMRDWENDQRAKCEGTYWPERDNRRTARQPTHVLVDPEAWRAMKRAAHLQRTTVGELVAGWVRGMAQEPSQAANGKVLGKVSSLSNSDGKVPLDHIVCRLAITRDDWARVKAHATTLGFTVARYVGLAVEQHASPHRH